MLYVVFVAFRNGAVVVPMSDGVEGTEISRRYRPKDLVPFPVGVRSLVTNSRQDEDKTRSGRQNVLAHTSVCRSVQDGSLGTKYVYREEYCQYSELRSQANLGRNCPLGHATSLASLGVTKTTNQSLQTLVQRLFQQIERGEVW